jgi:hypothetical protein
VTEEWMHWMIGEALREVFLAYYAARERAEGKSNRKEGS